MRTKHPNASVSILLADDDRDDRFFFQKALDSLSFPTQLTTVEDGEKLMHYLEKHATKLPDVLFLDLNMPRKNGSECLAEIKGHEKLRDLPVVIYSTSLHDDVADLLYATGAHYYLRKTDLAELKNVLSGLLSLLVKTDFSRPARNEFIVSAPLPSAGANPKKPFA
jgi:CheY-like chemotaxis protein